MNPYHLKLLEGHSHAIRDVATHGRTAVSGSYDRTVRVWDIITGECKFVLTGHTEKVKPYPSPFIINRPPSYFPLSI